VPEDSKAGYGGDVQVQDVWSDLAATPAATLIDVRNSAELIYVGAPDLRSLGKEIVLVAWSEFPPGQVLSDFAERLKSELDGRGIDAAAPLYFLCRSGQRSRSSAIAATEAGYLHCYNAIDGFEGSLDGAGHRATQGSWKAAGLPWRQS